MRVHRCWFAALAAALSILAIWSGAASAREPAVTVFAAASLRTALDDVNRAWSASRVGRTVRASYAGSSALARQIEQGAPADIFISADLAWMDHLAGKRLIQADSRIDLLGNRIVLVAPFDAKAASLALTPGLDLQPALAGGRLAVANVEAVPAGRYARAALTSLGAWAGVSGRLAEAENVRAALLLVARGEAPLGIVYQTDAVAEPRVRIIGTFPEGSHPAIVYPAALIRSATHPEARAYLEFLRGPAARSAFEKQGFTVLHRRAQGS